MILRHVLVWNDEFHGISRNIESAQGEAIFDFRPFLGGSTQSWYAIGARQLDADGKFFGPKPQMVSKVELFIRRDEDGPSGNCAIIK